VQQIKIAPPPPSASSDSAEEGRTKEKPAAATGYTSLTIVNPASDATIRDNSGQVSIQLEIEPALHAGDSVTILLDGREIGQGQGSAISLSNVDRGTHSLQVAIKNAQGDTVISSSTTTFHMQRTSALQR